MKQPNMRVKMFQSSNSSYIENRVNAFLKAEGVAAHKEPEFLITGDKILAVIKYYPKTNERD